jgi:cellulose synthase/poly-beta-1,6-N-acetylglucosamine synthase-like glycosyltransferase
MNQADIIISLGFIFSFIYLSFAAWFYLGMKKALYSSFQKTDKTGNLKYSIIMAAHNEEAEIERTLQSLIKQDYPAGRFEIIVIADRCNDGTVDKVRNLSANFSDLRFFEIRDVPEGMSPKKFALQEGLSLARFPNLLLVDADCRVSPQYLQTVNRYFLAGADVLINIPKMKANSSWLYHYLLPERLLTWGIAAVAAGHGVPFLSFGTTWGYTRNAYDQAGGLSPLAHSLSGDDDLLIYQMGRTGARAAVCFQPEGWGETRAPETLNAFIIQRRRHHSAGKLYSPGIKTGYLIYHLSNLALWVIPFFYWPALGFLLIKLAMDGYVLKFTAGLFQEKLKFIDYLLFEAGYLIHHLLIAPAGLLGNIRWR